MGLPETKKQQGRKFDETYRVRICICQESKNRKSNDEKGGDKQKKQRLINDNEKQGLFQFVSG